MLIGLFLKSMLLLALEVLLKVRYFISLFCLEVRLHSQLAFPTRSFGFFHWLCSVLRVLLCELSSESLRLAGLLHILPYCTKALWMWKVVTKSRSVLSPVWCDCGLHSSLPTGTAVKVQPPTLILDWNIYFLSPCPGPLGQIFCCLGGKTRQVVYR